MNIRRLLLEYKKTQLIMNQIIKFILFYKKIILVAAIITIAGTGTYKVFFAKEENSYNFALVERKNIVKEVSATGQVKKGEKIDLSFKEGGKIEKIYVQIGEKVESGKKLIKLETDQLLIQLNDARASLDLVRAECNNAQVNYLNAEQNLENVKKIAEENLKSSYNDAINNLEDSYLKSNNALNLINYIYRTYFDTGIGEEVREERNKAEAFNNQIKFYLNSARLNSSNENIDLSLSKVKDALNGIYGNLNKTREACELVNYIDVVSSTDKNSLDAQKGYINTASNNLSNAIQKIALTEINNKSSIDSAQASFNSAKANIQFGDIDLCEAKIKKAEASVNLLENKISNSTIESFADGQIIKINKELSEQVLAGEIVISLIPEESLQIELNIPESDIGWVEVNDSAKIILDAFSETEFSGRVIAVEPAETVISGVIYYKTKVNLEAEEDRIKPGMTADVTITADFRENVLTIPQRAITEKDRKKFVKLVKNGKFEEIEIQTGLKGSEGEIEVVVGLEEGDKVVTLLKEKK